MCETSKNFIFSVGLVLVAAIAISADITCWNCTSKDLWCVSDPTTHAATCNGTECYTYIDDKTTVRSCSAPEGRCGDEDKLCKNCTSDNCNHDVYPDGRRKCLQCDGGTNCKSAFGVIGLPCNFYVEADECFTIVESVDRVVRGCLSDGFQDCKTNEKCKKCNDDSCNNKPAEISQQSCYNCSSVDNKKCKRPDTIPETCTIDSTIEKCKGLEKKCFTYFEGNDVIRGCGDGPSGQAGDSRIDSCDQDDCNDKCTKVDGCYVCDSKDKAECADVSKLGGFNKTCAEDDSSCHLCENLHGNQTVRGCGKKDDENLICKFCWGKDCNNINLPKSCLSCDSSKNPNCAFNEGTISTKFCSDKDEKCYVILDSSEVTKRGCLSELPDKKCPENDSNCKDCIGHNCNVDVLVKDSVDCFKCSDSDGCRKDQNAVNGTSIKCSKPDDVCYMYFDDKTMHRGCLGDDNANETCTKNSAKCLQCKANGCNGKADSELSQLKCISCKSDDANCKWSFKPSSAVICNTSIPYNEQELCYALYYVDGSAERGCLSQNSNCTLQNTQCRICYDSGCNTESFASYSCIRCHSKYDAECDGQTKLKPTQCTNVPTADQLGCYVYNQNGATVRGCLSDLGEIDRYNCKNKLDQKCVACDTGDSCNNMKAPGSATMMQASMTIFLGSLILLLYRFI